MLNGVLVFAVPKLANVHMLETVRDLGKILTALRVTQSVFTARLSHAEA